MINTLISPTAIVGLIKWFQGSDNIFVIKYLKYKVSIFFIVTHINE